MKLRGSMRCCCIERAKPLNTDVRTVLETKEQRKKDVLCERVAAFVFTFIGVMLLGIGMMLSFAVFGGSLGMIGNRVVLAALGAACLGLGLCRLFLLVERRPMERMKKRLLNQLEALEKENQELRAIRELQLGILERYAQQVEDMHAAQEQRIAKRHKLLKEREAIVGRLERLLGKKNTGESGEVLL